MFISTTSSLHIITILITNFLQSLAITNSHQFKRHINILSDWEVGLREATYHALIRERHIRHPQLKDYLYSAPLLGRQDTATPFGDIAIIARGQLYSAPGGFQFVQDPYQNDCDGCHNTPLRCDRIPCAHWSPQDHERLLALWTVKRIRHRDSHYGFRYDFEYKISPMSSINGKPFITRNGNFDYSLEGHKFVVQRDPSRSNIQDLNPYKHVYNYPPYESDQWSPHYHESNLNAYLPPLLPPITEEYSDEHQNQPYGPNGQKDVFYQPELFPTKQTTAYTKDVNYDLHNNAIGTLTSKFTTRHIPSSTIKTTEEDEFLFPKQTPTSETKTHFLPTRPTTLQKPTLSSVTQMRFPTNRETTSPTYFSESTRYVQYSEPDPLYSNTKLTTPTTKFVPTVPQKFSRPPTTADSDYNVELFGEHATTPKVTNVNKQQPTNDYMLFGEQVITVVSPPNIPIKDDLFDNGQDITLIDRFGIEKTSSTKQETTQTRPYEQPTTTVKSTSVKPKIDPTQPTKTTRKHFFITKKPTRLTVPSVITSPTVEDKKVNNKKVTTSPQETKTTPMRMTTIAVVEEKQNTHSTFNNIATEDNTTINLSISTEENSSPDASTEANSYETEQYFEPTTEESLTTETPSPTTTTRPITTPKVRSTTKINSKPTKVTTYFPLETSAVDDSVFQLNFFGNLHTNPTISTKYPTSTSSSDIDDIFGDSVRYTESAKIYSIEEDAPKIIFSNFFLPPSMFYPTETNLNSAGVNVYTENIQNGTVDPVTSQSYITSVSFEVNKKNKTTLMQNLENVKSTADGLIDKMSVPLSYTDKEEPNRITQSSQILDSLTMSVLSHAKSISYLNEEQKENSTTRYKRNVRKKTKKLLKERKTLKIRKR